MHTSARCTLTLLALGCVGAFPRTAAAQLRAGANLGYVFDESNDFIQFGAEARATLEELPIQINPRFTYQPVSGTSVVQFDVNALYDLPLLHTSRWLPYTGAGLAIQHVGSGGGTHAGLNLIWGTELNLESPLQPYGQFQYTVIRNQPNTAALQFGILYNFGYSGRAVPAPRK